MSTKNRQTEEQPIPCNTITPDFTQHTPVGEIGIEVVAGIAAHFPIEMDPPDAIRRAYLLLQYASAGRRGEVVLDGYEAGIRSLIESQESTASLVEAIKSLPPDLFQELPPDVKTAPLNEVLANLMPRHRIEHRLQLFTKWVMWSISRHGETKDASAGMSEADTRIARMRDNGVPERIYLTARNQIHDFLHNEKSERLARAGKAGAEAKKRGKQGRVTKKTDKRTGSRLPGEKSPRTKKTR